MNEGIDFREDDEEISPEKTELEETKIKDYKTRPLSIEERDELICGYNTEYSGTFLNDSETEKSKTDEKLLDENRDEIIRKYNTEYFERANERNKDTDEIKESQSELISQEIDNYLSMISALSATIILDGILRYGSSGVKLDGQDRLPGREVKYAVPDLFSKFISQLWLVSQGDISDPLSKIIGTFENSLQDSSGVDSILSLEKEISIEEKIRLTKSSLLALDRERSRNKSIVSFGPEGGFDSLVTAVLETVDSSLNLATHERDMLFEQTRSAFQNLVAKVFGDIIQGENENNRVLIMVGLGINPLAWHIGEKGEVIPIDARFGPNAEDTRNTLSFTSDHIGRPALFDILVDTELLTMQVQESYILSDGMWKFLSGFFEKYDDYNLKNAYQYLLKYGTLNQYSKHFSNSSGTEIWSIDATKSQDRDMPWNPDFLQAAQILGLFLIPSYAAGITSADMTRTILPLLHGDSEFEVRVSNSLFGEGPFKKGTLMSIPVDKGSAYWTSISLDPSVSEWAERCPPSLLQQMYIAARLEIVKHMDEGMLGYKIIESGVDTSIEIDLADIWNKEIPESDNTVFADAYNVWRASFNTDENTNSKSNFAHKMFQLYQEHSISVMKDEILKLLGMSSDEILIRSKPIKSHISKKLHITWAIVETLQGAAEISLGIHKHYRKHEPPPNKWGGMGGEKLARDSTIEGVRTIRLLDLIERGKIFHLMIDEKIPRNNYKGTMIPFVPLQYVENGEVTRQVPLLIAMKGFGKGKSLLNPDLLWDIDSLLEDHPQWDTICDYRNNRDWSNFAVCALESLSDVFQCDSQKLLESIDILRFARETTRYMMVAKETPITARSSYMTKDGFPITLATSLFPYSYEHLGGALGQLYSDIFGKHNLLTIARNLRMDVDETDSIKILPYSFTVTSGDSEKSGKGETAADSRLLVWVESPGGKVSQERTLKLSYKTVIQSVSDKTQYNSQGLKWAFRNDKNDLTTPVLQVFDRYWVGLDDKGWLIRDIKFLNTEKIDTDLQKTTFIEKVGLLNHRLTSSLSISDWLGVDDMDILESHREIVDLVQKFRPLTYVPIVKIPERSITAWAFKMNRQGSLLTRISNFREQLRNFSMTFPNSMDLIDERKS
ncbi:hypothetical protein EU527_04520 [Candidatus Thorarchaeota archaeon]|nr:MAG: hypothetical protein EU527_04520 [Candidatus Thorarchaeota archaeon]